MANILTTTEAANVLRCATDDAAMLDLLPSVDSYIRNATGRDWTADSPVNPAAKSAARMLITMWHEAPAMIGQAGALPHGLAACLSQLEALALRYQTFAGGYGAGPVELPGAMPGDTVTTLTGLIGATGDRRADFETVITVADQIQQVSSADLSSNWYRVLLTPVGAL